MSAKRLEGMLAALRGEPQPHGQRQEDMDDLIAKFIRDYNEQHGKSPTRQAVARHFGLAETTARRHVNAMVASGRLEPEGERGKFLRVQW